MTEDGDAATRGVDQEAPYCWYGSRPGHARTTSTEAQDQGFPHEGLPGRSDRKPR